jgi:hypothetical protein
MGLELRSAYIVVAGFLDDEAFAFRKRERRFMIVDYKAMADMAIAVKGIVEVELVHVAGKKPQHAIDHRSSRAVCAADHILE